MRSLTFNGHNCNEYGIAISGEASYNAPKRDRTLLTIPGRDGAHIIDNGRFDSITVEYPAFFFGDFKAYAAGARAWLLGPSAYARLEDDYHTDEFRMAVYTGDVDFSPTAWNQHAKTTLSFLCRPQRFLTSGETVQVITTSGQQLYNPTGFTALPYVRVEGSGAGRLVIGYSVIDFSDIPTYIELDSDTQNAYKGSLSLNNLMKGPFPELRAGVSTVTWSGGITAVEITPRWWRI